MAKCRICGAPHRACGPSTTVAPVDLVTKSTGGTMALKEYEVTIDGRHPRKTTMLLNEADAKRLGGVEAKAAKPAANKARTPANKAAAKPKTPSKAAKPAAVVDKAVEEASDPDASEA